MYQLEICCYNPASAAIAQKAGAHRVELCADPTDGGTTPSFNTIKLVRKRLDISLYTIIRSRGGDFLFSEEEYEIMLHDVILCKELGCDGVVIGILEPEGRVDKSKSARLVEAAYPMGVTFHRAFDWTANPFEALEDIIEIGCERILTSGQQPTAIQGSSLIAELVKQSAGRISIMPGSGIRASNIQDVVRETGVSELHSSARLQVKSNMAYLNKDMLEEPTTVMADENEIVSMLHQLKNLDKMQHS